MLLPFGRDAVIFPRRAVGAFRQPGGHILLLGQPAKDGVDGALVDFGVPANGLDQLIAVPLLDTNQCQNTHLYSSLAELGVHGNTPLLFVSLTFFCCLQYTTVLCKT